MSQAVPTAPGLRVTLFRFAAGRELSEHTTPARVLVQVLAGTCDFNLPGGTRQLKAGDLLHLPPKLPHAVRATEELTLLITQATRRSRPASDNTGVVPAALRLGRKQAMRGF